MLYILICDLNILFEGKPKLMCFNRVYSPFDW